MWLALASLCVLHPEHVERLSSGQWHSSGDHGPARVSRQLNYLMCLSNIVIVKISHYKILLITVGKKEQNQVQWQCTLDT